MVVSQVVGVGIFLTPATMMRTLGSPWAALAMWGVMGTLSAAGALCYAELSTRFPKAGGSYVYLREAFGPRCAFVYGWMALLVMDPGLTAALGIGFAQAGLIRRTPGMVALPIPLGIPPLPVWLTTHRELFTSHRIRAIYDALASGLATYISEENKDPSSR